MEETEVTRECPALILVVDDSPTQAMLLEHRLKSDGYRVCMARNGLEAMAVLHRERPDLVISDIMMPKMDGFQLCRSIREDKELAALPVILLTHLNDPSDVLKSLEAGADYFISKPYSDHLLLTRIDAILKGERLCQPGEKEGEVVVRYRDKNYRIEASGAHTLELLLATYELAAEKTEELFGAKRLLSTMNRELEQRVNERTAALMRETAERLQAMEELRKKDEALIQQSRQAAMGEMIGNIAHQWRQPLNAVGLLVQDLTLSYEYGNFSKEYLDTNTKKIMQLVRHMSQTIDDFRNFFTPDREKCDFDPRQVVERTLALVEGTLKEKQIAVTVNASPAPSINGHPNEFSQALLNIINNAVDAFVDRRPPSPALEVSVKGEEGKVVVTVADNAGGVQEEILDRIFEPYFTTKEQGKGTGIGLFMAKNIVEKSMNGRLTVRNTEAGAEFRLEV